MVSANAQGKKRALDEAFPLDAPTDGRPHRNQRLKVSDGKDGGFVTDVQTISVKKKKITYLDSYVTTPSPDGYAFLPIGYRKIKEFCRNKCLSLNIVYYVVVEKPKRKHSADPYGQSVKMIFEQTGRIGWHFPRGIILKALEITGAVDSQLAFGARNPLLIPAMPGKHVVTMENLTDLFKDLYPEMPDIYITQCINHAFLEETKGKPRVGTSTDISWGTRVQLAVNAHIRHVHTDYDKRIKTEGRNLARLNIARPCVLLLIKWRGEDGEYEVEEQQREVVIIPDSEDESGVISEDEADSESDSDIEELGYRDLKSDTLHFNGDVPVVFRPKWPRPVELLTEPGRIPDQLCDIDGNVVQFDVVKQSITAVPGRHRD